MLTKRLSDTLGDLETAEREAVEAARPVELDQTRQGRLSRMDAMQAQSMASASLQRLRQQLAATRRALRRVDQNDFGEYQDCGEPIPSGRLLANPAVTRCLRCAESAETG